MTRTHHLARLGLASIAMISSLAAVGAAPATAAPSKLWYRVKLDYGWTNVTETAYRNGYHSERATQEVAVTAKTPKTGVTNEAPLVRRDRDTGKIEFGTNLTAFVGGRVTKSDYTRTETFNEPPPPPPLRPYDCSPEISKTEAHLIGGDKINALLFLSDGAFAAQFVGEPVGRWTDETGVITCDLCLHPHPLATTVPMYNGDSCSYQPNAPFTGPIALELVARGGPKFQDMLQKGHKFRVRGRFGAKSLTATSKSTARFKSEHGLISGDPYDVTETLTERVSVTFTLCPRKGRRPC
jgi:hypothetical protein